MQSNFDIDNPEKGDDVLLAELYFNLGCDLIGMMLGNAILNFQYLFQGIPLFIYCIVQSEANVKHNYKAVSKNYLFMILLAQGIVHVVNYII